MKQFVKENAVVILGVSLPLLLVVLLLTIHGVARLNQDPPAYPVAYASFAQHSGQHRWSFDIADDGRLRIEYLEPEASVRASFPGDGRVTIAVYDAAADRLWTFDIEAPDAPPVGERIEVPVPNALRDVRFDGSTTAPDGYRFRSGGRSGGGLFSEIFGTGGRYEHRLVDDGIPYPVPEIGSTSPYDHFIGWVVDGL